MTDQPTSTVTVAIPPGRIDPFTGLYLLTREDIDALIDAGRRAATARMEAERRERDRAYAQAGADAAVKDLLATRKVRPVVRLQTYKRDTADGPVTITGVSDVVEEITFEVAP